MKNNYMSLFSFAMIIVLIVVSIAQPTFAQTGKVKENAKKFSTYQGIKVCADFTLFPDNHKLPSNFELAGFIFQELGGSSSWFINETDGQNGLQFSPSGLEITLPIPISIVELEIGAFAGDIQLSVFNSSGTVTRKRTIPAGTYRTVRISGSDLASIVLTEGGNEAILTKVCVTLVVC